MTRISGSLEHVEQRSQIDARDDTHVDWFPRAASQLSVMP